MKWLITLILIILISIGSLLALPFKQKDTLSWDSPTTNTDGTPLTDLAGFKVYWSSTDGVYTDLQSKDVAMVNTIKISTTITGLSGLTYFSVTAYNTSKIESEFAVSVNGKYEKIPRKGTNLILK